MQTPFSKKTLYEYSNTFGLSGHVHVNRNVVVLVRYGTYPPHHRLSNHLSFASSWVLYSPLMVLVMCYLGESYRLRKTRSMYWQRQLEQLRKGPHRGHQHQRCRWGCHFPLVAIRRLQEHPSQSHQLRVCERAGRDYHFERIACRTRCT